MAAPRRAAPPPPIPKPGQVHVVRALFRYEATQPDELSFEEGDILYIMEKNADGWWKARCNKNVGFIPSNYVSEKAESIDNPLHEAAKRGNLPFLAECLDNKISVNGFDKASNTALHWAAQGGHTECAKMLLSVANVQVNVQNKLGDTPIHCAAWKNHADVVELLLDAGAKTHIKNNDGMIPYQLAKNPEVGSLLRGSVAKPEADLDYGDDGDSD